MKPQASSEQFLTVGDLAKRFQVSPTAVQRWDGIGWLVPVMRLSNGARLYRLEDVERFAGFRATRLTAGGGAIADSVVEGEKILQGGDGQ